MGLGRWGVRVAKIPFFPPSSRGGCTSGCLCVCVCVCVCMCVCVSRHIIYNTAHITPHSHIHRQREREGVCVFVYVWVCTNTHAEHRASLVNHGVLRESRCVPCALLTDICLCFPLNTCPDTIINHMNSMQITRHIITTHIAARRWRLLPSSWRSQRTHIITHITTHTITCKLLHILPRGACFRCRERAREPVQKSQVSVP